MPRKNSQPLTVKHDWISLLCEQLAQISADHAAVPGGGGRSALPAEAGRDAREHT
jgi:hypothetical protein